MIAPCEPESERDIIILNKKKKRKFLPLVLITTNEFSSISSDRFCLFRQNGDKFSNPSVCQNVKISSQVLFCCDLQHLKTEVHAALVASTCRQSGWNLLYGVSRCHWATQTGHRFCQSRPSHKGHAKADCCPKRGSTGESGDDSAAVAFAFGVHVSNIYRLLQTFTATGSTVDRAWSGRPRGTSDRQGRHFVWQNLQDHFQTATETVRNTIGNWQHQISDQAVRYPHCLHVLSMSASMYLGLRHCTTQPKSARRKLFALRDAECITISEVDKICRKSKRKIVCIN